VKIPGSTRPPRIHGELLKLGIEIGQTSVAKYMAKRRRPPSQGLENISRQSCRRHRGDGFVRRPENLVSAALRLVDCGAWSTTDFVVWRYIASDRGMDRKSAHGTMRLGTSPRYLIRDRDRAHGEVVIRRLRSMGPSSACM
jgi:hypothetical protein